MGKKNIPCSGTFHWITWGCSAWCQKTENQKSAYCTEHLRVCCGAEFVRSGTLQTERGNSLWNRHSCQAMLTLGGGRGAGGGKGWWLLQAGCKTQVSRIVSFTVCMFTCLDVNPSVSPRTCLLVYLDLCFFTCLYVCCSVWLSDCPTICLSVGRAICLSVCFPLCLFTFLNADSLSALLSQDKMSVAVLLCDQPASVRLRFSTPLDCLAAVALGSLAVTDALFQVFKRWTKTKSFFLGNPFLLACRLIN